MLMLYVMLMDYSTCYLRNCGKVCVSHSMNLPILGQVISYIVVIHVELILFDHQNLQKKV